jgi:hypothetical protein
MSVSDLSPWLTTPDAHRPQYQEEGKTRMFDHVKGEGRRSDQSSNQDFTRKQEDYLPKKITLPRSRSRWTRRRRWMHHALQRLVDD